MKVWDRWKPPPSPSPGQVRETRRLLFGLFLGGKELNEGSIPLGRRGRKTLTLLTNARKNNRDVKVFERIICSDDSDEVGEGVQAHQWKIRVGGGSSACDPHDGSGVSSVSFYNRILVLFTSR